MTLVELLACLAVLLGLVSCAFYFAKGIYRAELLQARAGLSDSRETIAYVCSVAARSLGRNRGEHEAPESFVREAFVRLESDKSRLVSRVRAAERKPDRD